MITDTQYSKWLKNSDAHRVVLVELQDSDNNKLYLSNAWYISKPTDTDPNRPYIDVIQSIPPIVSRYDRDATIGSLRLINNGHFDDWLKDAKVVGHPINIYLGDQSWSRDDFKIAFSGLCGGLFDVSKGLIDIRITDKRSLLNRTIAHWTNTVPASLRPTIYGAVKNITPIAVQFSTKIYYYCHKDGYAMNVFQVRDNGVPVAFTKIGNAFYLAAPGYGEITCDAGSTTSSWLTAVASEIAQAAGLSVDEIDTSGLDTRSVGVYVTDPSQTAISALNDLLSPLNIKWRFNRDGKLSFTKLVVPENILIAHTVTADDIVLESIKRVSYEAPVNNITVGYAKNWTVQNTANLAGSVSDENRVIWSQSAQSTTHSNDVQTEHPFAVDSTLETYLVSSVHAENHAVEQVQVRSARHIYRMTIKNYLFQMLIGEGIHITAPHYEFKTGQNAIIIGVTEDIKKESATIEVWL